MQVKWANDVFKFHIKDPLMESLHIHLIEQSQDSLPDAETYLGKYNLRLAELKMFASREYECWLRSKSAKTGQWERSKPARVVKFRLEALGPPFPSSLDISKGSGGSHLHAPSQVNPPTYS